MRVDYISSLSAGLVTLSSASGREMVAPDTTSSVTKSPPKGAMNRLTKRRGSLPLNKASFTAPSSPPMRERSMSFGVATKPVSKQKNGSGVNLNSPQSSPSLLTRSQNELRSSFASLTLSKHLSGLMTSSSEHLKTGVSTEGDRLYDHSHDHPLVTGGTDLSLKTLKAQLQRHVPKPQDELVFDYVHGEIKHRPMTAFGRTVHPEKAAASPPTMKKKSILKMSYGSNDGKDDCDVLSADGFINQCIIDSQTPRIKTAQRPQTSSTFGQLLEEFLPSNGSNEIPELLEIPPVKRRGRSNSLPVVPVWKNGL